MKAIRPLNIFLFIIVFGILAFTGCSQDTLSYADIDDSEQSEIARLTEENERLKLLLAESNIPQVEADVEEVRDIKEQLSGDWIRRDDREPELYSRLVLSIDGNWMWHNHRGSFRIAREESGFYHLMLFIEYSDIPYVELGVKYDDLIYDSQNEQILWIAYSGEGRHIYRFVRE